VAVVVKRLTPAPELQQPPQGSHPGFDPIDRVVRAGFFLAIVAVTVQTLGHLTNALVFDYEIWNLDATGDGNALSWASSVSTFVAGVAAFLLALLEPSPNRRFLALAAVFAFWSLDDVVGIHENLVEHSEGVGVPDLAGRAFWPLVYVPLLAFAVHTLWRVSTRAQERIRNAIRLALALFVVAFVAEAIATLWWSPDGNARSLLDDVEVAVEEGAELAGWILVATGLGALFLDRVGFGRVQAAGEP
jgi:hypothetical protein